ncbi:hypothetical protein GRI33_00415 [Brucella sp. BO3]|nr:hypothetical protein GRI33_00415 [Brucella sp. BO3]
MSRAVSVKTESLEPLYLFVFTHYPTHRSGIINQSGGLISPRRRFALLARKCSKLAAIEHSTVHRWGLHFSPMHQAWFVTAGRSESPLMAARSPHGYHAMRRRKQAASNW